MRWIVLLVLLCARAYAQDAAREPVLLVVESGPARVRTDLLARAIARETGRDVVVATSEPRTVLTVAWIREGRWIVRAERGDRSEHRFVSTARSALGAIARSSRAVLARLSGPPHPSLAWLDVDLVDPFGGYWAWDPVAIGARGELMVPFDAGPSFECAAVVDPFRREATIDLLDPWNAR